MSNNANKIKIIGLTGEFPKYIIVGLVSVLFVWMSGVFPYREDRFFLFSMPVGVIAFLSAIRQIRKPNLYIKYFLQISASALIAFLAYRSMSYLFAQLSPYIEVLFVFGFVFVHTLSIWNLPAATLIGDELYMPKTWIGKFVFRVILVIAPFGAIAGSLLGKAAANKSTVPIFVFGMLCLYLAFSIPFPSLSHYSKRYSLVKDDVSLPIRKLPHQRSSTHGKHPLSNKKK